MAREKSRSHVRRKNGSEWRFGEWWAQPTLRDGTPTRCAGARCPLLELLFEPMIDAFADFVGEVVGGVGVFDDELVFGFEEVEDGPGGGDAFFDAADIEVGVAE